MGAADTLLATALLISGAATVRIRHMEVPDAVRAGAEVALNCDYDLQGQTLLTVKWYKGSHEFYRYHPGNYPDERKYFALPRLFLNKQSCDGDTVVLRDVHADMSGYYTCEVTTAGLYETVQEKQYLLVVQPPESPPEITGIPAELPLDQWLSIRCHLPWMNVKPKLEFFINGNKAKERNEKRIAQIISGKQQGERQGNRRLRAYEYTLLKEGVGRRREEDGTTKVLELQITQHIVNKHHKVEVKCRATAENGLYTSDTIVEVPVRRAKSWSTWVGGSSPSSRLVPPAALLLLLRTGL